MQNENLDEEWERNAAKINESLEYPSLWSSGRPQKQTIGNQAFRFIVQKVKRRLINLNERVWKRTS